MDFKKFKQNVRNVKAIQKTRIQIGNGIYGTTIETLLGESPYLVEITSQRRAKESDKKKTAQLIKKALKELNMQEEQLDTAFNDAKKTDPFWTDLDKLERHGITKFIQPDLDKMHIYTNYLANIKGMGPITSAELIAIVGDITRFKMPSSLLEYCGCGDVRKLTHGVEANWNPKLKSLVLGVIGDNFVKQRSQYRVIYDHRAAYTKRTKPEIWHLDANGNKLKTKNMHPKHGYRDAIRVMMKRFLTEFWVASYESRGLTPPTVPYVLTLPNHHSDPQIVSYSQAGYETQSKYANHKHPENHTLFVNHIIIENHMEHVKSNKVKVNGQNLRE